MSKKKVNKKPITKDAAIEALWRKGIIAPWYLLPHQQELYELIKNTANDIVVPNISRRFGKTTTCVVYAIENCLKSKTNIRYSTAYLSDLQTFLKPIVDLVLASCPDDLRPVYHGTTKTYRFKNGSELRLIGLDKNPDGLRGNAIDTLLIDEAAFVSNLKYLYESIIVPATANRKFKILFPSTPPEDSEHFWLTLVAKAKERDTYIHKTIEDNTSISPEERKRLLDEVGGIESTTAQREFYCRVVRDENTVIIPEFSPSKHVKPLTLAPHLKAQTCLDLGGSKDKTGVVLFYYDYREQTMKVMAARLIPQNTSSKDIVQIVKELEKKHFGDRHIDRIADCGGQTRIDLSVAGLPTRAPTKDKDGMKNNMNGIRVALYNNQLLINDQHCSDLIDTLNLAQWDDKKEDFKRTDTLGHCDLLAALGYAWREQIKGNPYPEWYERDRENKMSKTQSKPQLSFISHLK